MTQTHLDVQMTVDDKTLASFCVTTDMPPGETARALAWAMNIAAMALVSGDGEMRELPQVTSGSDNGHRVTVVIRTMEQSDWVTCPTWDDGCHCTPTFACQRSARAAV